MKIRPWVRGPFSELHEPFQRCMDHYRSTRVSTVTIYKRVAITLTVKPYIASYNYTVNYERAEGRVKGLQCPQRRITGFFFNTLHLLPKDLTFEHGGAKLASCPGRHLTRGGSRGGRLGRPPPPKTYESNIFHHDFVQFRKTLGCQRRLHCQILLKSPPLNLRAGSASASNLDMPLH